MIQKNWKELIKPAKLDIDGGVNAARVATIIAEPLERGFGLTLGNSLRRILLSSLQGAAITAVQIDGVLHEFSSIPGVREAIEQREYDKVAPQIAIAASVLNNMAARIEEISEEIAGD